MLGLQTATLERSLSASAKAYYLYLESNNLGVEKIRVRSFKFQSQKLHISLGQKLHNLDGLFLRCKGRDFLIDDEEIELVSYDEQKLSLILEFSISTRGFDDFELLSDLKFLVKNVEKFFENHSISLPSKMPLPLDRSDISQERLNDEQALAMDVIFASPLSYVWGAPGSGKTQRVLFESLAWLLRHDKKVALIAPTNNALELALKTLIKKGDDLGLDRYLFLRLGVPSAEFLALYPESCDASILKKKQLSLLSYGRDRMDQARVFAMTLDGFIAKYPSLKTKFDHIFLDECGFSSLPKVCALCANPSPITMLGDHKQLSPICEISSKELQKHPEIQLWNRSALFLEAFFKFGNEMLTHLRLSFDCTKVVTLKYTYRYGDNLAKVLDTFIYRNGLRGVKNHNEIYVIDCGGRLDPSDPHTNPREVEAIKFYLRSFGLDYAIITPFIKQRQMLIQNGVNYEKVFTIHGSQGQEFDSVIFSPVTLHYHLTDSKNPSALQALNVAISRVKRHLILVCDVKFWQAHPDQLLSVLLKSARPWRDEYGTH